MAQGYAQAKRQLLAGKMRQQGLLIIHTGPGKGKSTAAFGMVLRCLGHGLSVAIVQFGKGSRISGERVALERFSDLVTIYTADVGGFSWEDRDQKGVSKAIEVGWEKAKTFLSDSRYTMVVLDELFLAMRQGLLLEDVVRTLAVRREGLHVVLTGRHAPADIIAMADLVTEMGLVKHPFRQGIQAQKGVEF